MNEKVIFTVEQLELIRRLRNSGLTKEQVLAAFDSFEKLDQQLGITNNFHVSPVSIHLHTYICVINIYRPN